MLQTKVNPGKRTAQGASPAEDRWTAFLASLIVPGAGQLLARSPSCIVWFLATALFVGGWSVGTGDGLRNGRDGADPQRLAQFGGLLVLGLLSAEHARRLQSARATGRLPWTPTAGNRSRVRTAAARGRQLRVTMEVAVDRPAEVLWQRISNLPVFLTIDPFHEQVVPAGKPGTGVHLTLTHLVLGARLERFGKILRWTEGSGYAFSDLSRRGAGRGFPHVFFVAIEPLPGDSSQRPRCRLSICVRGKWTSRWIPVCLGRLWVQGICREHVRLLRQAL